MRCVYLLSRDTHLVDCTWSVANTVVGAEFLTLSYITFNFPSTAVSSEYRGFLVLRRGVFPGFATTLGNVIAGGTPGILRHEGVHVLQARIFGPTYIPLVIANYIVATLLPYCLVYHDHGRKPIKSLGAYLCAGYILTSGTKSGPTVCRGRLHSPC
jgi:hypothetical protein